MSQFLNVYRRLQKVSNPGRSAHFFQLSLVILLTLFGCRQTPIVEIEDNGNNKLKERLINANKYISSSEQTQIDGYISRRGWKCETLPCGARLYKLHDGNGAAIANDHQVRVRYDLSTLNDKQLYIGRIDTLIVGRHQATVALDEALLRLRHGGEAFLISPSEAGYGVAGDGDRVSSRMVLVYKIKVE